MARTATIKEEIPEAKIRNAIWYLKKGKTKKFTCEYLNIPYNTKKLDSIIESFNSKLEREATLKKQAKTKIFTDKEKLVIAKEYLNGATQSGIATQWFVSPQRIKNILLETGTPIRARGKTKLAQVDHIEQDLEVKFSKNDRVFIATKNCFGTVMEVYDENYLDYLETGKQKYVETYRFKPDKFGKSGNYYEPTEGVHFELYWVLPDGYELKLHAMEQLRHSVMQTITDTGREFYLVWRDDEDSCSYYLTRDNLYPVKAH